MKLSELQGMTGRERSAINTIIRTLGNKELSLITTTELEGVLHIGAMKSFARYLFYLRAVAKRNGYRLELPEIKLKTVRRTNHYEAPDIEKAFKASVDIPFLSDWIGLAVQTGMRRGEIAMLNSKACDFNRREIKLVAEHTKTGQERVIPMTDTAYKILTRYFGRPSAGNFEDMTMRRETMSAKYSVMINRLGIACDFHDLRALWITTLNSNGVLPTDIHTLAGHASFQTTLLYIRNPIDGDKVRRALQGIGG